LEAVELTTELRVLGREGRSGTEEVVDVAGLAVEGEVVVVMAVEAAGLPAMGAVDNADPAHSLDVSKQRGFKMGWTMVNGGDDSGGHGVTAQRETRG
jgi:hypothetical protein